MMRSLYTAATGMIAQQTNLDTISNNLSNVNTTGYKTERTEFKSLLYQTLQTKTTTANGANKPVGAQVGLGTRVAATMSNYTQGAREETEIPTDFALEGKGFFAVRGVDGQTYYTRNGNFSWSQEWKHNSGNLRGASGIGFQRKYHSCAKRRIFGKHGIFEQWNDWL